MKKIFLFLQLMIALFFCSATFAQNVKPVSEPYWVVESNVTAPKHSIVYFYSIKHEVMYKETIDGKKLNIKRPKTHRLLNEVLKEVTLVWHQDKQMKADKHLVAKRF